MSRDTQISLSELQSNGIYLRNELVEASRIVSNYNFNRIEGSLKHKKNSWNFVYGLYTTNSIERSLNVEVIIWKTFPLIDYDISPRMVP